MTRITFVEKLAQRVARIDKEELLHMLTEVSREKGALESVLQALGDGVLLLDGSGNVLFANKMALHALGLGPRTSLGAPATSRITDATLSDVFSPEHLQSGQSLHREVQVYTPCAMLLSVDCIPIRGERGEMVGTAAILKDITEKRRMEGRMVQSEKLGALSVLAAGLAHEIGNPLNSIGIHLQLIERELKKLKGAQKIQRLTGTVQEEIERLDEIVNRFLVAIRPLKPRFEMHNINTIVQEVLRLLKPEMAQNKIQAAMRLDDAMPKTLLDRAHIKQALINIVKNALQAMGKEGSLAVFTLLRDNALVFRITDTGKGIAPENLSKIFDPYFTTRENGSGLGLMMTQRIIKEHGGEIEVKSEPCKGTEFIVTLPIRSTTPKMLSAKATTRGRG